MGTNFHTMELGVLLTMLSEEHSKYLTQASSLVRALVHNQCDWKFIKKIHELKNTYPSLFCAYEDLPLHINDTDYEDDVIVRWRLQIGK